MTEILPKSIKFMIKIIFIVLLVLFLIWSLIYLFPPERPEIYYDEFHKAHQIGEHTIWSRLFYMYATGLPPLFLGFPVSVKNIVYAIKGFAGVCRTEKPNKKIFLAYLIYAMLSLTAFVLSFLTFEKIAIGVGLPLILLYVYLGFIILVFGFFLSRFD